MSVLRASAFAYGMWVTFGARPVYLAFEFDRFRVIHASEIHDNQLAMAKPEFRSLPIGGPILISLRQLQGQEPLEMTLAALSGVHLAMRPQLWQPYDIARDQVVGELRPIGELEARFPSEVTNIHNAMAGKGKMPNQLGYLQLIGRDNYWTALVDLKTAELIDFLPLDSF